MSDWQPVVRKDKEKYLARKARQAALRVELEGVRREINNLLLEKEELEKSLLHRCVCPDEDFCACYVEVVDDDAVQASVRKLDARITEAIAKEARLCAQLR